MMSKINFQKMIDHYELKTGRVIRKGSFLESVFSSAEAFITEHNSEMQLFVDDLIKSYSSMLDTEVINRSLDTLMGDAIKYKIPNWGTIPVKDLIRIIQLRKRNGHE